jgi:hypothetical protein
MKPTDDEDKKLTDLKTERLPASVLAALLFLAVVAVGAAVWAMVIVADSLETVGVQALAFLLVIASGVAVWALGTALRP